ncbi:MAG: hypothetical protein ACYTG0_36910 [Planctomycetota bacterium]|jgi:hypothetical protein
MLARLVFSALLTAVSAASLRAQGLAANTDGAPPGTWQNPADQADSVERESLRSIPRVSSGNGELPREHGQLYKRYDISPYTFRVETTARPEQAIRDWILRETGYEAWHGEVLSILNADRRTLRVYHTPEMHAVVADVVARFVSTEAETHAFGLRVVTLSHPNWRARAHRLLNPIPVQTPGVQAWVLEKEDAAILLAELRRRPDYRDHRSPHLLVNNGQSTVVSASRGRKYIRSAELKPDAWPGFEPQEDVIDEGFSLEFSPLLSVDGRTVDAMIKCEINQIEEMIPVSIEVPAPLGPRQRPMIEVPQTSHFHFHERFRWPAEQVLLIGMGMVATPVPSEGQSLIPGLPLPLPASPARADLLVFVESKGKLDPAFRVSRGRRPESVVRGRR